MYIMIDLHTDKESYLTQGKSCLHPLLVTSEYFPFEIIIIFLSSYKKE